MALTKVDLKGALALIKKASFLQAYFPETGGHGKRSFQLTCGIERTLKVGRINAGTFTEYHRINVGISEKTSAPAVYMHESYGTCEAIKLLLVEAFREASRTGNGLNPVFHARKAYWSHNDQRPATFTVE